MDIPDNKDKDLLSNISTLFNHDVIKELIKSKCLNPKNKVTDEAVELVAEIAKVLVVEAAVRAAKLATLENQRIVSLDHVENIIPQIMLDFP